MFDETANTADAAYNNLDYFEEANEIDWVNETSLVNEVDVANMTDSFVNANEEANEDSIALSSGGKFNCCFMITSANVIAVASCKNLRCWVCLRNQSIYATTNEM